MGGVVSADCAARTAVDTLRPLFKLETILRIHFVQQWFGPSVLVMEENQGLASGKTRKASLLVGIRPGKCCELDKSTTVGSILDKLELTKTIIRTKVEYTLRVVKEQFGCTKVKYPGLAKNTTNLMTLCALFNT